MKYLSKLLILVLTTNAWANDNPQATDRYIDNGNSTITDHKTGLIWKKCTEGLFGENCTDGKAKELSIGESLKLSSLEWRLPSIYELRTLMDCGDELIKQPWTDGCDRKEGDKIIPYDGPGINLKFFPNTQRGYYWTSTPNGTYGDYDVVNFGWYMVTFGRLANNSVRLVKGKLKQKN